MDWNGLPLPAWWPRWQLRTSHSGGWPRIVFVALSFAIVLLLSILASATASLAIDTTVRFYWQCTLIFAVLAISSALFMRLRS